MKKIWILLISLIMLTTGTLYAQEDSVNQEVFSLTSDLIEQFMSLNDKEKAKFIKKAETFSTLEELIMSGPSAMSLILSNPILLNSFCHQIIVILVYEKSTASDYLKVIQWLPLLQTKDSDETIQEIIDLVGFKSRKFNRNDRNKIKDEVKKVSKILEEILKNPPPPINQ